MLNRIRNFLSRQPFIPIESACAFYSPRIELKYIDGCWTGPKLAHYLEDLMMFFPIDITKINENGKTVWNEENLDKYAVNTLFGKHYRTDVYYARHTKSYAKK